MHNFIIFVFLFLLDVWLKNYVSKNLKWNKEKHFFGGFIEILYVENKGVAFNFFENKIFFIITINLILLSYLIYKYFISESHNLSLMLIICGGFGNLYDRLIRGFVIDYFYFNIKKFPVFNFSDFYIIIGAIMFFI